MAKYIVKCIAVTGLDQSTREKPIALPFSDINHITGTMKRRLFPEDLTEIVLRYHGNVYQGKDACRAMNVFFHETEKDGLQTTNWDWFDGLSVQYSDNHARGYTITWKMFEKTLMGVKEIRR